MNYVHIEGYEDYKENQGYGFFGYASAVVTQAVRRDDEVGLQAMLDAGYITKESKTMDNKSMREYCEMFSAEKCARLFEREKSNA